ncbi:MAG: anaerobic ribonucleoside-triphosphate reductase activating protein [Clostridia bacterium]|nr:anaerobic ribonucleoside-triphosphate reductase activating protein [Clostridia bacterium]
MKFNGFQKLTLLDYPGKVACTLFTAGCNLRCPFCHNASLVTHIDNVVSYDEDEILDFLRKRQGILGGVCITGGEPLMQSGVTDFIKKVKELGFSVKLDTNGTFPEKLTMLAESKLIDYVAMDIKNCKEKYAVTSGITDLNIGNIEKSVEFLLSGKIPYEFRTTVVAEFHTPQDIGEIAKWIKGADKYYLQNFVDSGDLIEDGLCAVSPETMQNMRAVAAKFIPNAEIRGV